MSQAADSWDIGERIRTLGASEYLVYLLHKHFGATHLVRLIEFDGPVDPALMERAFRQMVARRTILRARVPATGPAERPFFVFDDTRAPSFTVRERRGPEDWVGLFDDELNTRLGVDGEPPIRAQLLASDEPGGELLLSCSHTFCDGRSLVWFCSQLLAEYEALRRGEDGDPSILTSTISPAVEDLLPEWATPERGQQLVADRLQREAQLPVPMPWPSQRGEATDPKTSRVLAMDLSVDELSAMRANARANGTTVLGALGAAMVLATDDVLHPDPDDEIVVTSTLDIRDRLRIPLPVENMGIYAATINSRHSNLGKMSEWDHARDFKNQVTEGIDRNDHYTWVFIGAQFVDQVTASAGDPLFTDTLANLGAMELVTEGTSLRPRTIRGAIGCHHATWPYMSFNGVGVNGHLAMTLTYMHPEISDERARACAAEMSNRIHWFATVDH